MRLVFSVLVTFGAAALAAGGMLLVRRRAPEGGWFTNGDRAAGIFGVLATGFALLLGFIVFLAFENYDTARSGAETEAIDVAQQFETAQLLSPTAGAQLGGELVCYARYVVHTEWPHMESGAQSVTVSPWTVALFTTLQGINPSTPAAQAAYSKWLDQTSDREQGRHDRVHGAEGVVPLSVWLVLFFGAAVVFSFMLLFADREEGRFVQAFSVGSVVALITATLLLIGALNRPFSSGPGGLKPVAMKQTLLTLDQARTIVGQLGPVPCDARGTPL